MRILHVRIRDFFSIQAVDLNLTKPLGLVLIEGQVKDSTCAVSNGAGKSALVSEPILWCLKGVTIRGAKGDDVVRNEAKWCMVEVGLDVGGELWCIQRFQGHPTHKNGIVLTELIIDPAVEEPSVDVSPRSKAEAQRLIDELIPLSTELLSSILILGEGFENRFASFTNKQKLEFIETLIGDSWDDPHHKARSKAEFLRKSIDRNEDRIRHSKAEAADIIQSGHDAAVRFEKDMAVHQDRYGIVEQEKVALGETPEQSTKELVVLGEYVEKARGAVHREKAKQGMVQDRMYRMNKLHGLGVSECPQCFQEVPGGYTGDQLTAIHQQLEVLKETIHETTDYFEMHEGKFKEARKVADAYQAAQAKIKTLDEELGYLRKRMEETPPQGIDQTALTAVQGNIQRSVEDLDSAKERLPYAEFWEKGFTAEGVRSYRIDSVLTWLNERLAHYCQLLYDGTVTVRLTPERALKSRKGSTKNEITIEASFPGANYFTASRGERRKADLALHLALQDLAIRVSGFALNLLVADEVLDSLDSECRNRALTLLRQRAEDVGTVFLVTHEEGLRSQVQETWVVVREGGVSRVER